MPDHSYAAKNCGHFSIYGSKVMGRARGKTLSIHLNPPAQGFSALSTENTEKILPDDIISPKAMIGNTKSADFQ
ncbi:hypothetical protein K3495_g6968 [Podosphaera aphanis]|nr:hypothetical protein K3495_g6968 [Podosphaera aphanis]